MSKPTSGQIVMAKRLLEQKGYCSIHLIEKDRFGSQQRCRECASIESLKDIAEINEAIKLLKGIDGNERKQG